MQGEVRKLVQYFLWLCTQKCYTKSAAHILCLTLAKSTKNIMYLYYKMS